MFILHIAVILHYLWIKDIYSGGIVSSHILENPGLRVISLLTTQFGLNLFSFQLY
jgi:hypothetical protein